jgi:hypothetical protein
MLSLRKCQTKKRYNYYIQIIDNKKMGKKDSLTTWSEQCVRPNIYENKKNIIR